MSWLWKSDTSSPASFEKALSKLSTQITSATLSLDGSRTRARRIKALWTLYTTLTYLLYTLVLALVLGPQRWSLPHYGGLLGGPVVVYLVRRAITLFFDWRIARKQAYVDDLQKQKEEKIADLKKATKFDSTQELLRKYGASPPPTQQSSKPPQQGIKRKLNPPPEPRRTGLPPPPTANIPGRNAGPIPVTPQRQNVAGSPGRSAGGPESSPPLIPDSRATFTVDEPGFAPNAFSNAMPPQRHSYDHVPHWYDRILDVLLGEDETLAKNRLVLICSNCRLVNGQAPPGVKTLEELGRWRCASCGAWNGVESEAAKLVKDLTETKGNGRAEGWEKVSRGDESSESPETRLAHSNEEAETGHESAETENADGSDGNGGEEKTNERGQSVKSESPIDSQGLSKRVTRSSKKRDEQDD